MAVIQDLVLTFCPTIHSVQQKKLKLLMPVYLQPDVSLVHLKSFSARPLALAHAPSTQKNIVAHIRSYHTFCDLRALQPFPISVQFGMLYIAYLVAQNRAYGTILNHISSLKHAHQLAGYRFQLLLGGAKGFLGQAVSRKSAITPSILYAASF